VKEKLALGGKELGHLPQTAGWKRGAKLTITSSLPEGKEKGQEFNERGVEEI